MKVTVEGIVLNETNYSETSKILNVLTKEYGYISIISKGSRTMKSKLRGISMKMVYAKFTISYKEGGISTLIEGAVIDSLKYIMEDFSKMNYAIYIMDLAKNVLKENNEKSVFDILINCLLKINLGFDASIITNIFEVKMLDFLGVNPNFSECINCSSDEVLTFDFKLGGMVCKNCYQDSYLFSEKTIKLLKLFQVVDIKKIDKLNISNNKIRLELNNFLKEYYETYTGIYLKNKDKFGTFTVKNM